MNGLAAGFGTFLYLTSESWAGASFMGLLSDYISPFIGCFIVWEILHVQKKADN